MTKVAIMLVIGKPALVSAILPDDVGGLVLEHVICHLGVLHQTPNQNTAIASVDHSKLFNAMFDDQLVC